MAVATVLVATGLSIWTINKVPCGNPGSCNNLPKLEVDNGSEAIYNNQTVATPFIDLTSNQALSNILGDNVSVGEKHIYVDLKKQKLSAYEGNSLYMQTPISSGKWNKTPPGEYTIWIKLRSTRMSGGQGSDYYNLPNVPYVMFFYNDKVPKISGFSLHGAYWHNNFGHAMSHGCVNMRPIDAEKLYSWATPISTSAITYADKENTGTKVTIY